MEIISWGLIFIGINIIDENGIFGFIGGVMIFAGIEMLIKTIAKSEIKKDKEDDNFIKSIQKKSTNDN